MKSTLQPKRKSESSEALIERASLRSWPLDAFRVGAICMVFVFHYPKARDESVFGTWAKYGWIGVDLFFVLSGYLIGSQILRRLKQNRFSFRDFYTSRFLRTLPIYLTVLAAYFALPMMREQPNLPPLWKFLTFTQNFGLSASAFSHAWSLCIEEQFYVLTPFILVLAYRLKRESVGWVLAGVGVSFGLLYRHFTWIDFDHFSTPQTKWALYITSIYYPTFGRLDGLIFGVGLAALRELKPSLWSMLTRGRRITAAFGFAAFALAIFLFQDRLSWSASVFGYPVLALSFTAMVASGLEVRAALPRHLATAISTLAILSYSFYLIHKPLTHALVSGATEFRQGPVQLLLGFAAFGLSMLAALIMYEAIERPFLRFRDRIIRPKLILS